VVVSILSLPCILPRQFVCFERLESWQHSAVVVEMQHSEAVEEPCEGGGCVGSCVFACIEGICGIDDVSATVDNVCSSSVGFGIR